MNHFRVALSLDAVAVVEILAEDEGEALRVARRIVGVSMAAHGAARDASAARVIGRRRPASSGSEKDQT